MNMRGKETGQGSFYSYVSQEERIPVDHPLRAIRRMVDEVLHRLSGRFAKMYSELGRPSIPPEQLLRALLIQAFYTVRSERQLMEQLNYNLLFRWFVGLSMDDPVWDATTFTKNRERLLEGDIAQAFFQEVIREARERRFLSDEHFSVDGTLIEAWAGQKSFRKKDDPGDPLDRPKSFHGDNRTNETHQSTTDPDARLFRKGLGKEAKLSFMGHAVIDNRHGLVVASQSTHATGTAEPTSAVEMIKGCRRAKTVGADKAFDQAFFVTEVRKRGIVAHVAQKEDPRYTAIDRRTIRHRSYLISQRARKRIEECFGWIKTIAVLRKTRHRGLFRVGWMFTFVLAAYNLVRMKNLLTPQLA
jgi:transposase